MNPETCDEDKENYERCLLMHRDEITYLQILAANIEFLPLPMIN